MKSYHHVQHRSITATIVLILCLHNAESAILLSSNGDSIQPDENLIFVRNVQNIIKCEENTTSTGVQWWKNGNAVSNDVNADIYYSMDVDGYSQLLTFKASTSSENGGEYTCKAETNSSVTINVVLHVPVYDVRIMKDSNEVTTDLVKVDRSQTNVFTCSAQGNPPPSIQWTLPSDVIDVASTGATLTFGTNANFQNNAAYTCTATNIVDNDSKIIDITVEGPPVLVTFSEINPPSKDSLLLSCEAEGNPLPVITWDGIPEAFTSTTPSYAEFKTTSKLSIMSALCFTETEVNCKANDVTLKSFLINKEISTSLEENYFIYKTSNDALPFENVTEICSSENEGSVMCLADLTEEFKNDFPTSVTWEAFYIQDCSTNSCKRIDKSTWSTSDCTTGTIENFICKVAAKHYPKSMQVEVGQCNNTMTVSWEQDNVLRNFTQVVNVVGLNGTNQMLSPPVTSNTIDINVDPRQELDVWVKSTDLCPRPPYAKKVVTSGYGQLGIVQQSSTEDGNVCKVTWDLPSFKWEIKDYMIYVVKNNENLPGLSTPHNRLSYDHPMDPASTYSVTMIATSYCNGKNSEKSIATTCTLGNRAPTSLPALTTPPNHSTDSSGRILIDSDNGIPVKFPAPSPENGPISCISVVVMRQNPSSTSASGSTYVENNLSSILSGSNVDNVADGDMYLAYTTSKTTADIAIIIGVDVPTSSCTPVPSSRRKRALGATYNGKNVALAKDKNYQYYIFTTTADGTTLYYASTVWSGAYKTNPAASDNIAVIIGVVVAVIILLALIALIAFLYWRRKKNEKYADNSAPVVYGNRNTLPIPAKNGTHINPAFMPGDEIDELPTAPPTIPLNKMRDIYLQKHADEDRLFRTEYANLASQVQKLEINYDYSEKLEVRHKNRFSNIHSANESLVHLRRGGTDVHSDYINASYIHGYRHPNKFIATQGPIPNTIADFWYMIYEQESSVVVMLTRLVEYGRKKCEKYWPDNNETSTYGNMLVTHLSTVVYGDVIKRTFECSNPNQSQKKHKVEQFHFIAWPDHGVPNTTSSLFNLRRMVCESQGQTGSPIVVHCSAGVGRSGAFIILDTILCQIKMESRLDIFSMVINLRRRRKEMVQTVEQYSLLHKLAWEAHAFGDMKDRTVEEFQSKFGSDAQYQELNLMEVEFDNLSVVPPIKTAFVEANPQNLRDQNIFPYQHSKVVVRMRPNESSPPFYNASHIKSYDPSNEFIACQGALPHQIEEFWRVVLDNEIKCIVMLTETQEDNESKCSQYWPKDVDSVSTYGSVDVTLIEESRTENVTERTLQVNEKVAYMNRQGVVKQYQLHGWSESSLPEQISDVLTLAGLSQQQRSKSQQPVPVLVHCSDGSGRTGTFCAITILIERVKNENRIDVFRTVKDLRDLRPLMVKTMEQYKYCYKVIESYLETFKNYSNFQ